MINNKTKKEIILKKSPFAEPENFEEEKEVEGVVAPASEELSKSEQLEIKGDNYFIRPEIREQIHILKKIIDNRQTNSLMDLNLMPYLHLLTLFKLSNPFILMHKELPIGFPTELENVKYLYFFTVPQKVEITLQNGYKEYFMFKKSIIAAQIDPPKYPKIVEKYGTSASELTHFSHWRDKVHTDCPNFEKLKTMCKDYDIELIYEPYSESVADQVMKASIFNQYARK